ncbi:MAG: toxin TcdB middle/N-terminal domain-containing protein, partial [Nitrospirota bacterium]
GYYDLADREFRGFGYSKQTNTDTTTLETWIHQKDHEFDGSPAYCYYKDASTYILDDKDLKGKPCHMEFRQPWPNETTPGALLSQTDLVWNRSVPKGAYPVFVKLDSKDVTSYVGGVEIFSHEEYTYDDTNGTTLSVLTSGPGAEGILTQNTFQNYGFWLWRNTRTTVTGGVSGKVRETTYSYENNTGNMLWKEFWLNGGTNPRITMTYTPEGNLETQTDARGNTTTNEYDSATKTFPSKITNALGHFIQNTYDYRFGIVECTWDENNNKTCNTPDEFGRTKETISYVGEGPQIAAKTKAEYHDFEYHDFGRPVYTKTGILESNAGGEVYIDKYSYIDGFGRNIQTVTSGEGGKYIISRTYYDNMGRVELTEGPFFSAGYSYPQEHPAEYPKSITTYDHFGKPTGITSPDIEYGTVTSTISYSGLS